MFNNEQIERILNKWDTPQKRGEFFEVATDGYVSVAYKGCVGWSNGQYLIAKKSTIVYKKIEGAIAEKWHIKCHSVNEVITELQDYNNLLLKLEGLYDTYKSNIDAKNKKRKNASFYYRETCGLKKFASAKEALGGISQFADRVIMQNAIIVTNLICGYADDADNGELLELSMQNGEKPIAFIGREVLMFVKKIPLRLRVVKDEDELFSLFPFEQRQNVFVATSEEKGYTLTTINVPEDYYAYSFKEEVLCKLREGVYEKRSKEHWNPEIQADINYSAWSLHKGKD